MKLEVCVADPQSLAAAIAGGADRIELCSALELGGLTPLPGLLALAAAAPVPAYAMIRPRPGDFVFAAEDADAMRRDIDAVRAAGLAGVVLGASLPGGALDVTLLEALRRHAEGLGATLHRAFDIVPDMDEATEAAIGLGFERILTSGGAATAAEGSTGIAHVHELARGRIAVMAGSGLRPAGIAAFLEAVPVDDIHGSCAGMPSPADAAAVRLGFAAPMRRVTDADTVRAMRAAIAARPGAAA